MILFVSGTDTGVGKTFVACALLAALREKGFAVAAVKPVETGFSDAANSDAQRLRLAAGGAQRLDEVAPYTFPDPVSPHIAAATQGVTISKDRICSHISEQCRGVDFLVVEGAGGLMVPFSDSFYFIDLLSEFDAAVVLVCGCKLGVINHSVLSFDAITQRGISCPGYVLNEACSDVEAGLARASNRQALRQEAEKFGLPELAYFPQQNTSEGASLKSAAITGGSPGHDLAQSLVDYYQMAR